MALFLEQGFDETTVEQIAADAGVSRSTFFRYFSTKEDVVLGDIAERGRLVQLTLEGRHPDEPAWDALRAALAVLNDYEPREATLKIARMLLGTESLRARQSEERRQWLGLLIPDIERRLGISAHNTTDPRARALVACVLTCLDVATEMWSANQGRGDLVELLDSALDAIRQNGDLVPPEGRAEGPDEVDPDDVREQGGVLRAFGSDNPVRRSRPRTIHD